MTFPPTRPPHSRYWRFVDLLLTVNGMHYDRATRRYWQQTGPGWKLVAVL